jgi:Uma2 family endonuclease
MDGVIAGRRPHNFTVADYTRMTEAGILSERARVELIRGQIIDMAAIGTLHFGMVNRLVRIFSTLLVGRGLLHVQNPVRLDDWSEPEPDVTVLKPRDDDYTTVHPRPDNVLLLIEVADSSMDYDRDVKAPLYAESGIVEYWIVNLADRVVEVFRQPENGQYSQVRRVSADEVLDITTLPGVTLPASSLLHPVP